MVRQGKKAAHKCPRVEDGISGRQKVQGPVPKSNSVGCYGQLNSSSLHKQTRRNPLSGDVCSSVENHDLVPSLPDDYNSLNVMADLLSRPNQVQSTEWSLRMQVFKHICQKWFTSHVDLFAIRPNHKVPFYISQVPDQHAWDIDPLNINWSGLTTYAYPPTALLYRVIHKIKQSSCLIILIAPGWPGILSFFYLVQLSTDIPLQLPVSTTLLKQSHNQVFNNNPHLNLQAWCLGVSRSKNKASLWKWQRELLPLKDHQQ